MHHSLQAGCQARGSRNGLKRASGMALSAIGWAPPAWGTPLAPLEKMGSHIGG